MADDALLSVKFHAALGPDKTHIIPFANGTTLASITSYAQAYAPIVEAVTEAQVTQLTVTLPIALPGGLKGAPGAGIRSNDGARFSFDTPGRYNFGLWVPAFKIANLADEDVILANVVAFTNAISAGLTGVLPTDGNGIDVGTVLYGKYAYRK
jgi:hypothetical protein